MSRFLVDWSRFTVEKKHDIDRDAPYLWVFGIVVDLDRILRTLNPPTSSSPIPVGVSIIADCVIDRPATWPNLGQEKFKKGDSVAVPSSLNVDAQVTGLQTAGVAVVAWERAASSQNTIQQAYDAAASEINSFIAAKIRATVSSGGNTELTSSERNAMRAQIEEAVRDVFKRRVNLVHDHPIGTVDCLVSIQAREALSRPLSFVFDTGGTRYTLTGTMSYTP